MSFKHFKSHLLILAALGLLLSGAFPCFGQKKSRIVSDFQPALDSLTVLMRQRTGVDQQMKVKQIMKRGSALDFYFDASLSDVPVRAEDVGWLRGTLQDLMPEGYRGQKVGEIYSGKEKMADLAVSPLGFDGRPVPTKYRVKDPRGKAVVTSLDRPAFPEGLSGRHIALWPSHGLYFDRKSGNWKWQRPVLFQTVEDLLSTSFVLPYLVPMLENAGACVMLPRERDVSPVELIVDNDGGGSSRVCGTYAETGSWSNAGTGFADPSEVYSGEDNPFTMGTARSTTDRKAWAVWTPEVPRRGHYAVYVSYKTVPGSTTAARYTVRHLGGTSTFSVNQTMGGGTWIYLGTFEFDEGTAGRVELDSGGGSGGVLTADAVKIGGGMGNIACRGMNETDDQAETSGMPRYAEGSRYWLQWAGMDPKIYNQFEEKDDYKDDYCSRGDWVDYMSGGSRVNPKVPGKGIPFDVSLAFHTDAGVTPNDTVVGSLVIYTRMNEWRSTLPDGEDRRTSRVLADLVQSQTVNDLRSCFDPAWQRRQIWNRAYRETRTPSTPAIITESLSHQNFADIRFAQDPTFKFALSRAVYKGILKYLSARYGCSYVVQPLPVHSFAAVPIGPDSVRLSWLPTADTLEETAVATGYMLYTRLGDGAFDTGRRISAETSPDGRLYTDVQVTPGTVCSFKVTALNGGGESFPSEVLAVGVPQGSSFAGKWVAVVNDFTRVSPPVWYDSPEYAGFNNLIDSGVPYIRDIAYTGEFYNNDRSAEWVSDENSGFGASYSDHCGCPVAGNTFDFTYTHGMAILSAGLPFCSMSADAFASAGGGTLRAAAVDVICGKQVTTLCGGVSGARMYSVFPAEFRSALSSFASSGGHILISGSHIGTDVWDRIYPLQKDPVERDAAVRFVESVLGFRWSANNACRSGVVRSVGHASAGLSDCPAEMRFNTELCETIYKVEAPDALIPAGSSGTTVFRYSDSHNSAAVSYSSGDGHRAVSFGFPLETLTSEGALNSVMASVLHFFGL